MSENVLEELLKTGALRPSGPAIFRDPRKASFIFVLAAGHVSAMALRDKSLSQ
jgi:hypothetical protein